MAETKPVTIHLTQHEWNMLEVALSNTRGHQEDVLAAAKAAMVAVKVDPKDAATGEWNHYMDRLQEYVYQRSVYDDYEKLHAAAQAAANQD